MKLTRNLPSLLCAAALLGTPWLAKAEDTDLFLGAGAAANTEVPNVLIIIDNTANWNTAFTNEMRALASTFANLPTDKFRVGLMMFTETGRVDSGNDGGYVRAAIRFMDAATKTKYQSLINSLHVGDDKSNGGKASLAMAEAWRYFSAGAPYAGNEKGKTDYSGNVYGTQASKTVYALTGNALASKGATTYVSPVSAGCQRNYIIYISNGPAQDNNNDTRTSTSMLAAAGGSTTTIPISPSGSQDNMADEWARWMRQSSLAVSTYTIEVDPGTTGQQPGWTALMKSVANVSNGKYYAVSSGNNGSQILDVLSKTLSEIQAVNSVFAAVSLPISVNTQGTYLNQVFVGMFRPDPDSFPQWAGNLKQYKMGYENGVLKLLDAASTSAINSQTGFVAECARSFWTPASTDTYWTFKPQGGCLTPAGMDASTYQNSNSPDGNVVEKGGQAYKLRGGTSRNVYTCSPVFSSCTTLTNFQTSNSAITQALLDPTGATERGVLIGWARGEDNRDENLNGATTEIRPSAHGDVVHSRPVAINFGTDSAPKVVVFYGGNDGMLRAINGNRATAIASGGTSYPAGSELWSFVAPEFYGNIKRLRDNSLTIPVPSVAGSANPKPYGFDGAITAYRDSSHAWIYATMRRGGRAIYAFNIDLNNPANVTLKWKKGCPNNFPTSGTASDSGCTAGFEGLGQTWSAAKPFKVAGYYSGNSPVLIMGGGYDTCEDGDPNTCTATSKGKHLYVLDADSGALLQTLNTDRGVVGDVTLVRDANTGFISYAYAADLGGNIYRVNIGNTTPGGWTMTKVAALGCATPATCANNRKFQFALDVVVENGVNYIMGGSGDREKPLTSYTNAYAVSNYFFMIKDRPETADWLSAESGNCGSQSVICLSSLYAISASASASQSAIDGRKGWYLSLAPHEQVVTTSVTLYGTTTFSTHQAATPQAGTCSANLGTANVYNIRYANAAPAYGTSRYQTISGGGLPPSPVAGRVTLDSGQTVPFVIGASPNSALEAREGDPGSAAASKPPKRRVYWYIKQ